MPSYVCVAMASKETRGDRLLSRPCATFRRCLWRPCEGQALERLLWSSLSCGTHTGAEGHAWQKTFFCGNLLKRRHCFHHIPSCCNAMQALLGQEGKGTKPTQCWTGNWLFLVAIRHLGTCLCVNTGGISSLADGDSCTWSSGRQG